MLIENPLNESSLSFPLLECVHLLGLICGVGTMALVNLRLLGVGLTSQSAADLWHETMPWTLGGLSVVICSGLLLFATDPDVYYLNYAFVLKMLVLVLAILFYYTAVCKAAGPRASAITRRIVACVSLGLWSLVVCGGIYIGLTGATLNIKKL